MKFWLIYIGAGREEGSLKLKNWMPPREMICIFDWILTCGFFRVCLWDGCEFYLWVVNRDGVGFFGCWKIVNFGLIFYRNGASGF
jgi:hypothetical protein